MLHPRVMLIWVVYPVTWEHADFWGLCCPWHVLNAMQLSMVWTAEESSNRVCGGYVDVYSLPSEAMLRVMACAWHQEPCRYPWSVLSPITIWKSMFPLTVKSWEVTFVVVSMSSDSQLRKKCRKLQRQPLPLPTTPNIKSNHGDRKPWKTVLKNCNECAEGGLCRTEVFWRGCR
jgi:hypothetical protein